VGCGLEYSVQEVMEECAGQTLPCADRLVLRDEAGEVDGVAGAAVGFDLSAHHGVAYLVEVTAHLRPGDVLMLHRQVRCAEGQLGRQVTPLLMACSMASQAERTMRQLGISYRVHATMDRCAFHFAPPHCHPFSAPHCTTSASSVCRHFSGSMVRPSL